MPHTHVSANDIRVFKTGVFPLEDPQISSPICTKRATGMSVRKPRKAWFRGHGFYVVALLGIGVAVSARESNVTLIAVRLWHSYNPHAEDDIHSKLTVLHIAHTKNTRLPFIRIDRR